MRKGGFPLHGKRYYCGHFSPTIFPEFYMSKLLFINLRLVLCFNTLALLSTFCVKWIEDSGQTDCVKKKLLLFLVFILFRRRNIIIDKRTDFAVCLFYNDNDWNHLGMDNYYKFLKVKLHFLTFWELFLLICSQGF